MSIGAIVYFVLGLVVSTELGPVVRKLSPGADVAGLREGSREVALGGEYGRRLHLDAPPARLAVTRGGRLSPAFRALLARRGRLVVDAVATVPQADESAGTDPREKRFRARLTLVG